MLLFRLNTQAYFASVVLEKNIFSLVLVKLLKLLSYEYYYSSKTFICNTFFELNQKCYDFIVSLSKIKKIPLLIFGHEQFLY